MTGDKDNPQGDDDRTRLSPMAGQGTQPPAESKPVPEGDDDDKTRFAPVTQAPSGPVTDAPVAAPRSVPPVSAPPPLEQPRTAAITAQGTAAQVTVGTLINNNYQVTDVLKSGGMGEVYRGVEIGTGDPVAIKAILPELAEDEKAGLLFKREARTLRQLADEAIVRYYNYVHDRDLDRYFLVMEFIEGVPLSDHIAQSGAIPAAAAQTLLKRLARGLAKAHHQDVVHRDLSPDNVMLPGGSVAEARLIDFGIAKSNVVKEGTMHGQFAGKFKYVAPEQLGDYEGKIGPATDIYGLALLICAATLGKPLDMGASIIDAVRSRQQIPDLSQMPAALRPILSHMLEPDPAKRPASMEEVLRLLEQPALIPAQYLGDGPVPQPVETTGRSTMAPMPTAAPKGLQVPTFGQSATTQTAAPSRQTQSHQPLPPEPDTPADKTGSRVLMLLGLAFLMMLGGAGFYGWYTGLLGGAGGPGITQAQVDPAPEQGIPAPNTNTREGFLAQFDTGPCTFADRVSSGPNAGMIEGYSATGQTFDGLPVAYEEKFGARPAILPRQVTDAQCAALSFARALQGRGTPPLQMQLDTDEIASGAPLTARIATSGEQAVWTVLISPLGAVYNLTDRLTGSAGGPRALSFGLNLAEGAEAAPQLVMTVATDRPLARAAASRPGASAAELLPSVLEEIAQRGGASVALSYVLLTPAPAPEPESEPEPQDPGSAASDDIPPEQ